MDILYEYSLVGVSECIANDYSNVYVTCIFIGWCLNGYYVTKKFIGHSQNVLPDGCLRGCITWIFIGRCVKFFIIIRSAPEKIIDTI